MPSTWVYFDALPPMIALMAACLMLSGVSKSGSPAPRPMTSRPAAFSARALSVTAIVGDGLMRLSCSARKAIVVSCLWPVWDGILLRPQAESGKGKRPSLQRNLGPVWRWCGLLGHECPDFEVRTPHWRGFQA